ncbi:MAG: hypothetical protein ACRDD7_02755 [Peptostreptococcaceae bacterium]
MGITNKDVLRTVAIDVPNMKGQLDSIKKSLKPQNFRGEWSNYTQYSCSDEIEDTVLYNGLLFACVKNNINQTPLFENFQNLGVRGNLLNVIEGVATTVVGKKIIGCGGYVSGAPISQVFSYDTETNTTTILCTLPLAIAETTIQFCNGYVYVMGGNASNKIYKINPTTGIFTEAGIIANGLTSSKSCVLNNKIYLVGGIVTGGVITDIIMEYNPVNENLITSLLRLPSKSILHDVISLNGKIYRVGGTFGGIKYNKIDCIDITNSTVTPLTITSSVELTNISLIAKGDEILVIGNDETFIKTINVINKTITPLFNVNKRLYQCEFEIIDNNLYILSGKQDGAYTKDVIVVKVDNISESSINSEYWKLTGGGNVASEKKELSGKTIVNFGDSIFGNIRDNTSITNYLSQLSGATCYNVAFGGCRMSWHENSSWDAFSMYNLAGAICDRNFTLQDRHINDNVEFPSYFRESLDLLKSIDFSKVDYITIAYGTNDYSAGVNINNLSNLIDCKTYEGALRYSLKKICETYPNIKILVLTPTYRFDGVLDSDSELINGKTLIDFVNSTILVSKELKIPCLDNYNELGINKYNRNSFFITNDKVHLNEKARYKIANRIKQICIKKY